MTLLAAISLSIFCVTLAENLRPSNDVDIWIDPLQARALQCRGATLDIIRNGEAQSSIQKLRNQPTALPADIKMVNVTWRAAPGFRYSIQGTTGNTEILTNPTINIPPVGVIPTSDTVFQVGFPCTGRRSGTGTGRLIVKIWDATKKHVPASPLKIPFKKECEKKIIPCHPPCENGAVCAEDGVCECPEGYYGTSCKHALCIPHCYNGGSCVSPHVCHCPDGYSGDRCQYASCQDDCSNRGQCVAPNTCVCRHGWTGPVCETRQR